MEAIDFLEAAQNAFKDFKFTTQTVKSDQVLVTQYVRFTLNCHDQAQETLTIHTVVRELKDSTYGYLSLRDVIDGPVTDGNREQKVDDCTIQTAVKMEPFIEGVTNNLEAQARKPAKTVALQEVKATADVPKVEVGCQSNSAS